MVEFTEDIMKLYTEVKDYADSLRTVRHMTIAAWAADANLNGSTLIYWDGVAISEVVQDGRSFVLTSWNGEDTFYLGASYVVRVGEIVDIPEIAPVAAQAAA